MVIPAAEPGAFTNVLYRTVKQPDKAGAEVPQTVMRNTSELQRVSRREKNLGETGEQFFQRELFNEVQIPRTVPSGTVCVGGGERAGNAGGVCRCMRDRESGGGRQRQ